MAGTPEIQPQTPVEIPNAPEVGPKGQEAGVEAVSETPSTGGPQPAQQPQQQADPQAQVTPVPAPADPAGPAITIPSDQQALKQQSKGSVSDAKTWSAVFWLRMVKKALLKHWNVLVKGGSNAG